MTDETTECTCDLHEVTTREQYARGELQFVRGLPNGCPIHETSGQRDRRIQGALVATERAQRVADAMRAARLAP
jgi:hypothetical protein